MPYVLAIGNRDKHPSDTERALYMLGFLEDHVGCLPTIIKKWEEKGTSLPLKNMMARGRFDFTSQAALQAKMMFAALKNK